MTRIFKKVQRDKNEEVFEGFWSVEFALTRNYERECDTFTLPHTHTKKNTRLRTETTARFIVENDDDDDDDEFFIFIIPGIIYSREQ